MTQNNTNTPAADKTDFSLVLNDPEGESQQAYVEEVGTLVFQSAIMRFLVDASDEVAIEFEDFIEKNVSSEKFIEDLSAKYPNFKNILEEEMTAFSNEMKSIS